MNGPGLIQREVAVMMIVVRCMNWTTTVRDDNVRSWENSLSPAYRQSRHVWIAHASRRRWYIHCTPAIGPCSRISMANRRRSLTADRHRPGSSGRGHAEQMYPQTRSLHPALQCAVEMRGLRRLSPPRCACTLHDGIPAALTAALSLLRSWREIDGQRYKIWLGELGHDR